MKQLLGIFLFCSFIFSKAEDDTDVKHMIVLFSGKTITGYVDSINVANIYYLPKDSLSQEIIPTWKVYYIYNDFDRVFHYSKSFEENMRRINNSSGIIQTISNDTIRYQSIQVNKDMINPEFFITLSSNESEFYPLLDVKKVVTDYSIMEYSVERGFRLSFTGFFLAFLLDRRLKDFMPKFEFIGLKKNGVTYESFVHLIPLATGIAMVYDYFMDKRTFYFTPVLNDEIFGRSMYVFSLRNILGTVEENIVWRIEKTSFGGKVVRWIRKKVS
tara:strand:- start:604 stop:1419 length:816 start_codon:yes stop_codon:yes gene_type:complete